MKKLVSVCIIAFVSFIIYNISGKLNLALAALQPCELFTQSDAEALFKESVSSGISRDTMFPAGKACRYSFNKNGGSYNLDVRVCESAAIKAEGIQESAADVMAKQTNARKASPNASKTYLPISELGDDAFWSGTDLWVLTGDILIIINVNSFLDGTYNDMASANNAQMEQIGRASCRERV